jgi:Nucleotide modification associated domain 2
MAKLYSYVLRYDDGAAPNPFWDVCTLVICKPAIRRTAEVGDWIVGTGSVNSICNDGLRHDLSSSMVYAMKVTSILTMRDYDYYCQRSLPAKLPDVDHKDWRMRMGDCIYHFPKGKSPVIRPGVHNEDNREMDLSGQRALLSTHFYYFGENAHLLPENLLLLVKRGQGHKKIEDAQLIDTFEEWISLFPVNTIGGEPQLKHVFNGPLRVESLKACGSCHTEEDRHEEEERIC